MSLVRAETRRLFKRRLTRYTLALLVAALAVIAVSFSLTSQKVDDAAWAAARKTAAAEEQRDTEFAEADRRACEQAKEVDPDDPRWQGIECEMITGPPPGTYQAEWYLPYEFNFREQFGIFIAILASLLCAFGFIVGASFIGAEWNSGGMMNLLLWRPKRLTVLLTKLGVLLGGVLTVGLTLGALWTGTFYLIGRYDGRLGKLTSGVWQSFALDGARAFGLVLAVTAIGFGLASVGRHTAMALGAAVAVFAGSEIGMRIVMGILGVPFGDRYVLSTYAVSWFMKKYELVDWNSCNFVQGMCEPDKLSVTWQDSALVFGIGTAAVLAAAVWLMRRRDIT